MFTECIHFAGSSIKMAIQYVMWFLKNDSGILLWGKMNARLSDNEHP